MASPSSLHAPLDPTPSSSKQTSLPRDLQPASSSSSPRSRSSTPLEPSPLSNLDFYKIYHVSHATNSSHKLLGRPPPSLPKPVYQSQDPSFPLSSLVRPNSKWSSEDKNLFFAALSRHGKSRSDLVAEELRGRKSFLEVTSYLHLLETSTKAASAPGSGIGGQKRLRWSREKAPAAREVTKRWRRYEDELAEALLETEEAEEEEEKVKRRRLAVEEIKGKDANQLKPKPGRKTPKEAKLRTALDKNERGWTREDWSASLNPDKLLNLGLELVNPILTSQVEAKDLPAPLPPPIDVPERLSRPMKDLLDKEPTYEEVQALVTERAQLRQQEELEKEAKVAEWEKEKERMFEEMKKQAKPRVHIGGTRLKLAKLGVLKRYQQDGLDLFYLGGLGRHLETLPSHSSTPDDADLPSELSYLTLVELKAQLKTYVSNLLRTSIGFRAEKEPRRSFVLDEEGAMRFLKRGEDGDATLITAASVRRAQGMLGGGRYVMEAQEEEREEEEELVGEEGGEEKLDETREDGDRDSSSEDDEDDQPAKSVTSSRQGSTACSTSGDDSEVDPNEDPYSLFDTINPPLYLPLPISQASTLNPKTSVYPIPSPSDVLDRISSLPYPQHACTSFHPGLLTLSSLPPSDLPDDRPTFFRPRDTDLVYDSSDDEMDDGEEGDVDSEMEEEEEKGIERRDRKRDTDWDERVWKIVEAMDPEGSRWMELLPVMEMEDDDLLPPAKEPDESEDEFALDPWDGDEGTDDEVHGQGNWEEEEERLNDGKSSDASVEQEQPRPRSRSVSGTPVLGSSALGSDTEEEEEKRDEKHEEGEDSANEREEDVEMNL